MNRLAPWLLAAVAWPAAPRTRARPSAKMKRADRRGPSSAATAPTRRRRSGQLVAVANTRGDDLRDHRRGDRQGAGWAPTLVAALSVPTEPRPTLIAAGRLDDLDDHRHRRRWRGPTCWWWRPRGLVARPGPGRPVRRGDPGGGHLGRRPRGSTADHRPRRRGAGRHHHRAGGHPGEPARRVAPARHRPGGGRPQRRRAAHHPGHPRPGSEAIVLGDPSRSTSASRRQDLGFTALDLASPPYDLAFPRRPTPVPGGNRLYVATSDPIPGPGGVLGVGRARPDRDRPGPVPVRAIVGAASGPRWSPPSTWRRSSDNDPDAPSPTSTSSARSVRAGLRGRRPAGLRARPLDALRRGGARPGGRWPGGRPGRRAPLPAPLPGARRGGRPRGQRAAVETRQGNGYLQLAPGSGQRWTQSIGGDLLLVRSDLPRRPLPLRAGQRRLVAGRQLRHPGHPRPPPGRPA